MVLARPWRMAVGGAPLRLAGRAEHRRFVHLHCGAPAAKGALLGRAAWQALGKTAPRMVRCTAVTSTALVTPCCVLCTQLVSESQCPYTGSTVDNGIVHYTATISSR